MTLDESTGLSGGKNVARVSFSLETRTKNVGGAFFLSPMAKNTFSVRLEHTFSDVFRALCPRLHRML